VLHEHGLDSQAIDVSTPEAEAIEWSRVHGALVGASLHMGRHQKSAAHFVHEHAAHLNAVPSAFFSVSLAAASKNANEVADAERIARAFPAAHGYSVFVRFLIKRIAKKEGGPTDTSRDHELTDWDQVDRLGREMAQAIHARVTA
jgi:menaquinone-dependent protoporphyrinogen oxidase